MIQVTAVHQQHIVDVPLLVYVALQSNLCAVQVKGAWLQ